MEYDFLQMFSDSSVTSAPSEENVSPSESEESGSEEEFEALIKGKYAEAFRKRTQGIIDRRFSRMKGFERTAKAVTPLLEELTARFPAIDKSDTEGLISAFLSESRSDTKESDGQAEPATEETSPEILRAAENAVVKRSQRRAPDVSTLTKSERAHLASRALMGEKIKF